jgi:hypothetical protein
MTRIPLYLLIGIAFLHSTPVLIASEDQDQTPRAEKTASMKNAPVSVVVLPPVISEGATDEQKATAELWCDQLAAALGEADGVSVVDRTALAEVLAERKSGAGQGPMLSYQWMVRLRLDTTGTSPTAHWSLLDLSDGNIRAHLKFDAADREDRTQQVARRFRQAVAVPPPSGQTRVRVLPELDISRMPRELHHMRTAARIIEAAMDETPSLRRVMHIEAATAAEESLLLSMNLSKLPDGQRFMPQCDATLELRVRELGSPGREAKKTPVEFSWRLTRSGQTAGKWNTARGTAGSLLKTVLASWPGMLRELDTKPTGREKQYIASMETRRRQAELEIEKAGKLRVNWRSAVPPEHRKACYHHIATAAKLDPTWEFPQRYLIVDSYCLWPKGSHDARDASCFANLAAARRYLEQHPDSPGRSRVISAAYGSVLSMVNRVIRERKLVPRGRKRAKQTTLPADAFTPVQWQAIGELRRMVEVIAARPYAENWTGLEVGTVVRYIDWLDRRRGVSSEECNRWLEGLIESLAAQKTDRLTTPNMPHYRPYANDEIRAVGQIRRHLMKEALKKEDVKCLARHLPAAMRDVPDKSPNMRRHGRWIQPYVTALNDPKLTEQFERWKRGEGVSAGASGKGKTTGPRRVPARFAKPYWPGWKSPARSVNLSPEPVRVFEKSYRKGWPYALAWDKDRAVILLAGRTHPLRDRPAQGNGRRSEGVSDPLWMVSLGADGKPTGQWTPLDWPENLTGTPKGICVTAGLLAGQTLYMGTRGHGLVGLDLKTGTASQWGTAQLMPSNSVHTIHRLNDGRFLCSTGEPYPQSFLWTFDPESGKVQLIDKAQRRWEKRLRGIWQEGQKTHGVTELAFESNLLDRPKGVRLAHTAGTGWRTHHWRPNYALALLTVGARRYLSRTDGLDEIDSRGKTIRRWAARMVFTPAEANMLWSRDNVGTAGDMPYKATALTNAGDLIFMAGTAGQIVMLDPVRDTWYGPISIRRCKPESMQAVAGHLWLNGTNEKGQGVLYVLDPRKLVELCREKGAVLTAAQWQAMRKSQIETADPLTAGKLLYGQRRFADARQRLESIAKRGDARAMLLMGWTYEAWADNDQAKANEWYVKLAEQKSASARYTGLAMQTSQAVRAGKWPRVAELVHQIRREYDIPNDSDSAWLKQTESRAAHRTKSKKK